MVHAEINYSCAGNCAGPPNYQQISIKAKTGKSEHAELELFI